MLGDSIIKEEMSRKYIKEEAGEADMQTNYMQYGQGKDGKWYTYLPDGVKGRIQRERCSKKDIEGLVVKYWKTQEENPTIGEVFNEWNDRRLELKKISDASHLRNRQIYNRHYGEMGNRRIKSVSMEEFEDFLEEQVSEKELTAKAFSNLKTVTRGLLKRAKK